MTNFSPHYPGQSDVREFRRAMLFAERLADASRACETNFSWLSVNNYRPITLLDFDVICGALPTVAAQKALIEIKEHSQNSETKLSDSKDIFFDNLVGPSTLRFHLHNLSDFVLPHGSAAELLNWKARLSGQLSTRSKHFMDRLYRASKAVDPATVIVGQGSKHTNVSQLLHEEIKSFEDEYNDLNLLEQIIDRALPIEDLVQKSPKETRSGDAFRAVLSYLQSLRPNASTNNLNDAINVSLLVRLFNSPVEERAERHVPTLISGTRFLAEFPSLPQWFYLPYNHQSPPDFIKDKLYLVVMQSLYAFNESRYKSVIDDASLLREQASDLVESYRDLLLAIEKGRREDVPFQLELAQHKQEIFYDSWSTVFEVAVNSAQLDRTFYSNLLMTHKLAEHFESNVAHEVRSGINLIIEQLQNYRHPIFDHWQIMGQASEALYVNQFRGNIDLLFDLSVSDNDGTLISELNKGKQISGEDTVDKVSDSRYMLHLKSDPIGAVLAIDSWSEDSRGGARKIGIVWKHKSDAVSIWKEAIEMLKSSQTSNHPATASCFYQLFTRRGKEGYQTTLGAAANVIAGAKPGRYLMVQYFEIRVGQYTFFADTQPLHDTEMQAGLVMDRKLWKQFDLRVIAKTIAETSVVPLSDIYYADMIKYIAHEIGL